jgi:hypothetical protein
MGRACLGYRIGDDAGADDLAERDDCRVAGDAVPKPQAVLAESGTASSARGCRKPQWRLQDTSLSPGLPSPLVRVWFGGFGVLAGF